MYCLFGWFLISKTYLLNNALLDLFVLFLFGLCLFACFVCLIMCFLLCLIHLLGWLLFITFCFAIVAGMVRQYKSMQNRSQDKETVKTVSRETVRDKT